MGWIFLWAFLDEMFALGLATGRDPKTGEIDFGSPDAWINGGSPTEGFLAFGLHTKEPFTDWYTDLAGQGWVDWVYMISMAAIGVLLIIGILARLAAIAGIVWMVLFYTGSGDLAGEQPIPRRITALRDDPRWDCLPRGRPLHGPRRMVGAPRDRAPLSTPSLKASRMLGRLSGRPARIASRRRGSDSTIRRRAGSLRPSRRRIAGGCCRRRRCGCCAGSG